MGFTEIQTQKLLSKTRRNETLRSICKKLNNDFAILGSYRTFSLILDSTVELFGGRESSAASQNFTKPQSDKASKAYWVAKKLHMKFLTFFQKRDFFQDLCR